MFERALAIGETTLAPNHPYVAVCLVNLARLLERQGNLEEAKPRWMRALMIEEKLYGVFHPKTRETATRFQELLHKLNLPDEVAALRQKFGFKGDE